MGTWNWETKAKKPAEKTLAESTTFAKHEDLQFAGKEPDEWQQLIDKQAAERNNDEARKKRVLDAWNSTGQRTGKKGDV